MASSKGVRAGRAHVELFADDSRLVRGLRRAQQRLQRWGSQVRGFGAKMAGFAGAALAPVALATKIFASFGDQMAKVRALTQASAGEFEMLSAKAKELGRTTSFTASQVAAAMVELGRAGFKSKAIDDSIEGVLSLARATDTELPRAAEIAGKALRQFQLEETESARVADVLTATANNSAQGLEDIGESMKVLGPIAVEANESIEDTSASLAILANNGIKGSLAGNSLARAYKNLSTSKAQKELKDLAGVDATDGHDGLRKLHDIMSDLGKATAGFGSAKKLAVFETLFGRGQAASLKLAGSTAEFKDLQGVIKNSQGVAKKTAAMMDDTLGGSFRKLMSAVEGVAIAIAESFAGDLAGLVDKMTAWAGTVTQVISDNKELVAGIIKGTAVVGALGIAIVALGVVIGATSTILSGALAVLGAVKLAFAAIAVLISPGGLIVVGLVAAGAAFVTFADTGKASMNELSQTATAMKETLTKTFAGMMTAIKAGRFDLAMKVVATGMGIAWLEGIDFLMTKWDGFVAWMKTVTNELQGFVLIRWEKFKTGLKTIWAALVGGLKSMFLSLMQFINDQVIKKMGIHLRNMGRLIRTVGGGKLGKALIDFGEGKLGEDIAAARKKSVDELRAELAAIRKEGEAAEMGVTKAMGESVAKINAQRDAKAAARQREIEAKQRELENLLREIDVAAAQSAVKPAEFQSTLGAVLASGAGLAGGGLGGVVGGEIGNILERELTKPLTKKSSGSGVPSIDNLFGAFLGSAAGIAGGGPAGILGGMLAGDAARNLIGETGPERSESVQGAFNASLFGRLGGGVSKDRTPEQQLETLKQIRTVLTDIDKKEGLTFS